jgi:hypothetical protein
VTERRKKIKYPVQISKPIVLVRKRGFSVPDPSTVSGREAIIKENANMFEIYAKAVIEKMRLLLIYYHMEKENDWFSLALRLASDHVPGFHGAIDQLYELHVVPDSDAAYSGPLPIKGKSSGRPPTWPIDRLLSLVEAVEEIKHANGLSMDRDALRRLARRSDWKPPANHRGSFDSWIETLESRLQDAKNWQRRYSNLLKSLKNLGQR